MSNRTLSGWVTDLKIDRVIDYGSLTLKYVANSIKNEGNYNYYLYKISQVKGSVFQQQQFT